ncbi:MAG: hypothetical protein HGA27_01145 [Peptococcaceae bacterium]|nr:hypothetical protein [Peptococcaceae bacterium]
MSKFLNIISNLTGLLLIGIDSPGDKRIMGSKRELSINEEYIHTVGN